MKVAQLLVEQLEREHYPLATPRTASTEVVHSVEARGSQERYLGCPPNKSKPNAVADYIGDLSSVGKIPPRPSGRVAQSEAQVEVSTILSALMGS